MNRYRSLPGLGPQKATATTVCQKCLKKDIYDCKTTVQERPYVSRPSRSQQLFNPKLAPRLMSDVQNGLTKSKGVADEQLAQPRSDVVDGVEGFRRSSSPPLRRRSRSASASDSVSTISTNQSRSSARIRRRGDGIQQDEEARDSLNHEFAAERPRKRKQRSMSASSTSRSPPRFSNESNHKNRRRQKDSPDDRGRPNSVRRGSHRSRTDSLSNDRSQITKTRRSLDLTENERRKADYSSRDDRPTSGRDTHQRENGRSTNNRESRDLHSRPASKKERSLSPYSRRLALTQAMNIN